MTWVGRIAVDGKQRMALGKAFELDVANELRLRGLRIDRFGQALLSDDVREVLKTTQSLLRWLPDLVGWRPSKPKPFLVDAKSCIRTGTPNHSMELRVLLAAHFTDLPVFYVCDDFKALPAETVWPPPGCILRACCDGCLRKALADPTGRQLPKKCPEHIRRNGRGSGTPYALIERSRCQPLDDYFGSRRCTTCDQPESGWDPADPRYSAGSSQCPDCLRVDSDWPDVAVPGGGLPEDYER